MSEPFIAEIRIFALNFAPRGWAFCDGQLLPIAQNTALFSLVGTTYGGDGRTTFGLPNLQGRAPMHPGNGPGLSPRRLGESGGSETVALTEAQIGAHAHGMRGTTRAAQTRDPQGALFAAVADDDAYAPPGTTVALSADAMAESGGGGRPHGNLQPFLVLNFVIALLGTFPSRS